MLVMKIRILLTILFIITTTLSAMHEIKHIQEGSDFTCEVCIVDNHSAADIVESSEKIEIFHHEKISQNNLISNLHVKTRSNQNRAPPVLS